ncbi:acyloxyacyl hydrolase [Microvirga sp. 2MCAF38]|uniref:acyloxyacyl hydrolase n=1 Tax=Microvirga sp. 2MCAF38 TaxID=3232989 RepID=UPI003F983F4F
MRRVLAMIVAVVAIAAGAHAADLVPPPQAAVPIFVAPPPAPPSFLSEVRLGVTAHDPGGQESGSANLSGEILSGRPFIAADPILNMLIPRFHVGGSLNFNGQTSFGYAGLTWTFDITPEIFIEGSFGGAFHNGKIDPVPHRDALGCSALFRESGAIGFRFAQNWSVMAIVEHLSNAGLCSNNRGLTNVGLRVGYTF